MKKVNYITTTEIPNNILKNFIDDNPHHNGHCFIYVIMDHSITGDHGSAYPEIDQYFINQGLKIGEEIFIHSIW